MRAGLLILAMGCTPVPATDPGPLPLPPDCPVFAAGVSLGTAPSPPATEISGVAVAPDGRLFAHNDSGEGAQVHVLDRDGTLRGTLTLDGVEAIDFEDIAIGPALNGEPHVFVGDIGDNLARRTTVVVYRFPLPSTDSGTVTATPFIFVYPDGPRDAETLLIDPDNGTLWIVSKALDGVTAFYRSPLPRPGPNTLERVTSLTFGEPPLGNTTLVTGGDFVQSGLVLRTYLQDAFIWPRLPEEGLIAMLDRDPCRVRLAPEGQPEAIAWGADGLYTISEGLNPNVNFHALAP